MKQNEHVAKHRTAPVFQMFVSLGQTDSLESNFRGSLRRDVDAANEVKMKPRSQEGV